MKLFYAFLLFPCLIVAQIPGNTSAVTGINATISYQGYGEAAAHVGTGEYQILYDNVDGVLDKPIFFVDGFDPDDSRTIPLMYDLLNFGTPTENLAETLRNEGFDIVVLNFPTYTSSSDGSTVISGGADFIQRNAFILVELINTINGMKSGSEENVVIGPSMGGLISRYALRYMEQNSMDHDTRLFISFDAPHLGANVPIGIQYLFNYMVYGPAGITEAEPLVNGLLNSAAAKQMLIDHYQGHLASGSDYNQNPSLTLPIGAPNFRNAFQSELDAMGFPVDVRNISITNGSGLGTSNGTPGMELINHTFNIALFTNAEIIIRFTPLAGQSNTVSDVDITVFGGSIASFIATSASPATSDGLDSSPGGQFDLYSFDDGTNAIITEFVDNLNTQYFSFIPTLSGLAISNSNWYAAPNAANSPFDNVFIPDVNEPHVTLTPGNVAFALDEILNPTLSISTETLASIRLKHNPISDNLVLLCPPAFSSGQLAIYDTMGKRVFQTNTALNAETRIPVTLNPGLYILNINTANGYRFKQKLVVRP